MIYLMKTFILTLDFGNWEKNRKYYILQQRNRELFSECLENSLKTQNMANYSSDIKFFWLLSQLGQDFNVWMFKCK